MLRTHTCGELRAEHAGKTTTLCGWVEAFRVQGKIAFLMIKDRYGITQVFVNPSLAKEHAHLSKDSVVKVVGEVKKRPDNQVKKELLTGEIEVSANTIEVLNPSEPLPYDEETSTEETRLKYRYLDLRTERMTKNMVLRHKVMKAVHAFLNEKEFIELETPLLGKSTPEGARDYLVPSRKSPGKFYALPQSPQIFKQLLMISGYDKYYQVARCLRDEDLRADRQPEFTQLDIEMSFVEEEDIYSLCEHLMKHVFKEALAVDIKTPFPRMSYKEAMEKHNSDKPNLSKGEGDFQFLWVNEFPMLEYSEEEERHVAVHHPFTSPREEDMDKIESDPDNVLSRGYDLVLNGFEIAGGSIRIHRKDIQEKIFKALHISQEEAESKFGFLLDALKFGAPPMGGIAFGIDRVVAIMANEKSIREVITFPKNQDAKDVMTSAPSDVADKQLDELGIKKK